VLAADKAINAIGCSGTEQPDCLNLWDVNKIFGSHPKKLVDSEEVC
jgi:hypothetical protein